MWGAVVGHSDSCGLRSGRAWPGPGMAGAGNDGNADNASSACVAGIASKAGRDVVRFGPSPLRQAQGRLLDGLQGGRFDGLSSGQAHHQQGWPGDADARAARKGGLLLAWRGSWGWQPPSSQPSPSREKEKNGRAGGWLPHPGGVVRHGMLRGLRTGSPRTVSRVASTGRRAGHRLRPYAGSDEEGGGWFDTARRKTKTADAGSPRTGELDRGFARMGGLTAWRAEAWARGWDAGFS